MRKLFLLSLLVGCNRTPPRPPPQPPDTVIVHPDTGKDTTIIVPPKDTDTTIVVPDTLPPPPPPRDTIHLIVFPPVLEIPFGQLWMFCVGWHFEGTDHIAIQTFDNRLIGKYDMTCREKYKVWFSDNVQKVTKTEQGYVDSLQFPVQWGTDDTTIANISPLGGVLSAPRFATIWRSWSQRTGPGAVDSTGIVAIWRGQIVWSKVRIRARGWFVGPDGSPCGDGSPQKPWDLKTALNGGPVVGACPSTKGRIL
jgi:hypothetical protein